MRLLDTDTLTHLRAGHPRFTARLQNCPDSDIGAAIITKIELLRGRMDFLLKAENKERLLRARQWLAQTEMLLEQLAVAIFDHDAAELFDKLKAQSSLRKIGRADLMIVSIVLANRATLVTRNVKHFKQFPGLRVVNWVD
jgi:tRNA(fMet)-specific endonuclease VapC